MLVIITKGKDTAFLNNTHNFCILFISFIFNTTEIIMSIYVSANYNYHIEENVNLYLKMNYTSKTEDAVCRQYPSLCASAGITFSFPDKRLQLNIACHELFRKEYSD